ncbi:DODA-type extradiol aromatic ring-opening family dioxygenase [Shewanella cyperi]|uniref:DODA-type extradiol aromatic ring-opening family dioxygenase n=1 Tax=Shewanella cyperi TaxID=2814292 RepID=UPI001A93C769|nr:class III extradiol ring-cleavage dioxygenase [Shewanella cyperi]QSX40059.1 dioxygenase [Shewanella cyperi]
MNQNAPAIFIPHGGGPLPLLDEPGHRELIGFLKALPQSFPAPDAIVIISAHWEEEVATITSAEAPELIYDYSGFPPESYRIRYPAPGHPALAARLKTLLERAGIDARLDAKRGFDHGMFVPLKLMYPEAQIPCVQLSLVKGLSPSQHIAIGKAIAELRTDNVLILGSGFSFHNLRAFGRGSEPDRDNLAFEAWLIDICTNAATDASHKARALTNWQSAPGARHCHPREEHLLPLHVCFGAGMDSESGTAQLIFDDTVLGKKTAALRW